MLYSTRWRQLVLGGVFGVLAVASASVATAARDPQVTGAAKFASVDAQVRLHAHGNPARGEFFIEQGTSTARGTVTCINVVGNRAVAGGVITESSVPSVVGNGFLQFVEDNGSPGSGDFSQTNGAQFGALTPPGGTCPAPIHPFFQVDQGNWVIQG